MPKKMNKPGQRGTTEEETSALKKSNMVAN